MPSAYWHMKPREAEAAKFSFPDQDQFASEASGVLEEFRRLLRRYQSKFPRKSKSRRTAQWLLLTDALGSLREASAALEKRNFRTAASLFRVAEETTVLARCLRVKTERSEEVRRKWFEGKVIPASEARACLRKSGSASVRDAGIHRSLSELTHRTFPAVLHGTVPAKKLAHVEYTDGKAPAPAATLAVYYAVLSLLIRSWSDALIDSRLATNGAVVSAWQRVLGEDIRCPIRTKTGTRCSRIATTPEGRCWQHRHAT